MIWERSRCQLLGHHPEFSPLAFHFRVTRLCDVDVRFHGQSELAEAAHKNLNVVGVHLRVAHDYLDLEVMRSKLLLQRTIVFVFDRFGESDLLLDLLGAPAK